MTQAGWPARYTRVIAQEIRRYRQERGVSAQQLSDACAERGLEISRSTIADLENGRRESISVAELIVVAACLQVSPIMLMLPVLREETIEMLPGRTMFTWQAGKWIRGDGFLVDIGPDDMLTVDSLGPDEQVSAVALQQMHDGEVARWHNNYEALRRESARQVPDDGGDRARLEESLGMYRFSLEHSQQIIANVRAMMRERGLLTPGIPTELLLALRADRRTKSPH
jgi:transcriptional regulator with XRE-family HTH domain